MNSLEDGLRNREAQLVHREVFVLIALGAVVIAGFFLTRAAAASNRAMRLHDEQYWGQVGRDELAAHHPAEAVTALRRAVAIDRDDRRAHLDLARALETSHEEDGARQLLLALREPAPEDPEINVQLARLEAARHDVTSATRYYQNALYGVWNPNRDEARRQLRVELIRFLLTEHQAGRAAAEIQALSTNLPDDVRSHLEAGHLFLDVGDAPRARAQFERALVRDPRSAEAMAGAGEAAFALGDYRDAARDLREAPDGDAHAADLRRLAVLVLTWDPLESRVSPAERRSRLSRVIGSAADAVDACLANLASAEVRPALESLRAEIAALAPLVQQPPRGDDTQRIEDGVDLVYRAETAATAACGAGDEARALMLIGRRHAGER